MVKLDDPISKYIDDWSFGRIIWKRGKRFEFSLRF